MTSGSDGPAQLGVQPLDSVRGVDDFANAFGKREERNDQVPVAAPALRDRRILLAPRTLCEGVESGLADLGVGRAIDARSACATFLRSFQAAKSMEWRIR